MLLIVIVDAVLPKVCDGICETRCADCAALIFVGCPFFFGPLITYNNPTERGTLALGHSPEDQTWSGRHRPRAVDSRELHTLGSKRTAIHGACSLNLVTLHPKLFAMILA